MVRTESHSRVALGGVMDVGFHHRRVDAQFLAVFQTQLDAGLDDLWVDAPHGLGSEVQEGPVESIVFGDGLTVKIRKDAQRVTIVDAIA
jgi:hypothetical protein